MTDDDCLVLKKCSKEVRTFVILKNKLTENNSQRAFRWFSLIDRKCSYYHQITFTKNNFKQLPVILTIFRKRFDSFFLLYQNGDGRIAESRFWGGAMNRPCFLLFQTICIFPVDTMGHPPLPKFFLVNSFISFAHLTLPKYTQAILELVSPYSKYPRPVSELGSPYTKL